MQLEKYIRNIPDYPKKGIQFKDITTLLAHPEAFKYCIECLKNRYENQKPDIIVGLEARGFILGSALAYALGVGFVPIRKKGKLPGSTIAVSYQLEYGEDTMEIHDDAIKAGQKVVIVDDLMATGGTMEAGIKLIEKLGGEILETCIVIDLPDLKGSERIQKLNHKVFKLIDFEGH
jgi:adenine phosphoribosyltransferase